VISSMTRRYPAGDRGGDAERWARPCASRYCKKSCNLQGFSLYGEPGPGRHITIYANSSHAFMVVDGRRYDTSALGSAGAGSVSQVGR
jgi:hypothetical protein